MSRWRLRRPRLGVEGIVLVLKEPGRKDGRAGGQLRMLRFLRHLQQMPWEIKFTLYVDA